MKSIAHLTAAASIATGLGVWGISELFLNLTVVPVDAIYGFQGMFIIGSAAFWWFKGKAKE